jgi:hypothetical protein
MVERRNLSGVFFRQKNEETGEYENVCFEELRKQEKKRVLETRTLEWKDMMIMKLCDTLNKIGDQFNIAKE